MDSDERDRADAQDDPRNEKAEQQAEQLDAHVVAVRERQAEHELQRAFLAFVRDR